MMFNITALAAALAVFGSSCGSPADTKVPDTSGSGAEKVEKAVDVDFRSIHLLNQKSGSLNSHKDEWTSSCLEMDKSSHYVLASPQLMAVQAMYPRIKQLSDGSYFLMYQQGQVASNIYYGLSKDLSTWDFVSTPIFARGPWMQYDGTTQDTGMFSSADAIVLSNGDILAFASLRLQDGYRLNTLNNGIVMRRSSDNGKTWGEPELIYRGTNWEPSALELSSGEIHVYFTSSDPNKGNSGTALLRSFDKGRTWQAVGKIIRQYAGTAVDGSGDRIYTDQMPVAIQLNGSERIAVAFESRFGRTGTSADKYHLGMAYSSDNWAAGAAQGDDDSPVASERQNNLFLGQAAPYIRQFRSGETVLTCNIKNIFNIRIGDSQAYTYSDPMPTFAEKGFWGAIEKIDEHTMVAVYPMSWTEGETKHASIQVAKFVLNHRINATALTPDKDDFEWKGVDDAFFLGSDSDAQATFRFAYDADNIYCLVQRKDAMLSVKDGLELYFQRGDGTGAPLSVTITPNAKNGTLTCSAKSLSMAVGVDGSFDGQENDEGYAVMLAVPRKSLGEGSDRLLFNAVLNDGEVRDSFFGLESTNYDKWLPVVLKAEQAY